MRSLLLVALIASPLTPEARLASAIEDFEFGEHEAAVSVLEALLDPIALEDRSSVLRARAYLGAGQVLLGREARARETFSLLLALDPGYRLDAAVFPPQVVTIFADVRRASGLDVLAPPSAPAQNQTEAPAEPPPLPAVTRAPPPPVALAFVPFGVGQFANDHPVRGSLFAGMEVGLFTAALVSFLAFEGLKAPDGTFAERDVGEAETLQTTYLATFWTGVGVSAIGIVEALLSHPGDRGPPAATRASP